MREHHSFRWTLEVVLFSALVGCSSAVQRPSISQEVVQVERDKQMDLALRVFQQRYERLMNVFYPLQIANPELCGEGTTQVSGFTTHSKTSYEDNFQESANRIYRFNEDVLIRYVHPQSPAQRAGLSAVDRILAVEGEDV